MLGSEPNLRESVGPGMDERDRVEDGRGERVTGVGVGKGKV